MFANSMFSYYFSLALRSFKRNKALTALMVIAIALGIGASMTTLTVFHVLSGDPIPQKSDKLFYPRIDPQSKSGYSPGDEPASQMTRYDAEKLLREKRGDRQALMTQGNVAIEPDKQGIPPFYADSRFTTADFFAMFDAPFARGRGWSSSEEEARAHVAVVTTKLSEKLFGAGIDSIGKTIRMDQKEFKVIGVLAEWSMAPRFYDMTSGSYSTDEQVFLPFWTAMSLKMDTSGDMSCWGPNPDQNDKEGQRGINAPCVWLQYWVELGTPAKVAAYKQYLINYSDQQRAAGRFERPTNTRLHSVMEWLDENNVVPPDVRLQSWLAFGFLFVCLLNTVGLLLAKFLRRSSEIGVRRALGATRRTIFAQFLIESSVIGLTGGLLGLALAYAGLWAVRQQPTIYAEFVHFDSTMLLTTIALTLIASLLAGILPAWRACQVTPAIQLKSQ